MRHDPPAAPAVRDELERILSSETFKRSERARELLSYLVAREQLGEAERLKGYAIAVDVFGRDSEFDSSTDAVVRVQAGRLRELLAQYYAAEGRGDPIRMVIPRGSYAPAYEDMPAELLTPALPEAGADEAPAMPDATEGNRIAGHGKPPSPRPGVGIGQVRLLWGALAFVAALLVAVAIRTSLPGLTVTTDTAVAPETALQTAAIHEQSRSEALPTIRVVGESDDPAPQRVAALFRTALASFDTLDLIGGEYSENDRGLPPDAMGFVLLVAPGAAEGGVLLELQSLGSGRVLLNRSLSASQAAPGRLEGEVASLVNAVAPMNGVIYGYLKQSGLQSALVNCLLLNNVYYFDRTERNHLATYRCFEKLAEAHAKSPLVYAALVSLRVATKTEGYRYPENPSDEDTMVLARRAVQIGPTSSYAHGTMGYLYSQMGDFAEATHWMRKAHELNTFDLSMAAAYGYALVFSGEYREGASLLQRAVDLSSVHPTWWDYCLFLAEFMKGDIDKAAQATNALSTAKKPQYLAARLVVAHLRGDERHADALVSELVDSDPKFAADPAAAFRDDNYPLDLILKFVDALKVAGLGEAS